MRPDSVLGGLFLAAVAALVVYGLYSDRGDTGMQPVAVTTQLSAPQVAFAPPLSLPAAYAPPGDAAPLPPAVAAVAPPADAQPAEPVLPNYIAPKLQLYEAHWQGLDSRKLDAELRQKLKYPKGLLGILIGEVTLNAAASGLLAGDILVSVEDMPVTTLEEFQAATKQLRNRQQAQLKVLRKTKQKDDNGRFVMKQQTIMLRADSVLGMAQVEGAPMIAPGDLAPHPERGPCTDCHAVGSGFELTPDPDLIVLPPPPITQATAAKGQAPHRDRGPCHACHVITR